jgi:hypothetical protein
MLKSVHKQTKLFPILLESLQYYVPLASVQCLRPPATYIYWPREAECNESHLKTTVRIYHIASDDRMKVMTLVACRRRYPG